MANATNKENEFGFVPASIVADLANIGAWKSRATAIDNLQKALHDVSDKQQLLPGLGRFVAFLVTLVADPNFKIAISSMQILGDLVAKVGREIESHLKTIIPNLVEKFSDSKILVRNANLRVLKQLLVAPHTHTVLRLLACGMSHTSWRVREEVINTAIMALLQPTQDLGDPGPALQLLVRGMGDPKDKVRAVALEGLAVLAHRLGSPTHLLSLLAPTTLTDSQRQQVSTRLADPALPTVSPEGVVEHLERLGATSSEPEPGPVSRKPGSLASANKLPWESQPQARLRAGLEPRPGPSPGPGVAPLQHAAALSLWCSEGGVGAGTAGAAREAGNSLDTGHSQAVGGRGAGSIQWGGLLTPYPDPASRSHEPPPPAQPAYHSILPPAPALQRHPQPSHSPTDSGSIDDRSGQAAEFLGPGQHALAKPAAAAAAVRGDSSTVGPGGPVRDHQGSPQQSLVWNLLGPGQQRPLPADARPLQLHPGQGSNPAPGTRVPGPGRLSRYASGQQLELAPGSQAGAVQGAGGEALGQALGGAGHGCSVERSSDSRLWGEAASDLAGLGAQRQSKDSSGAWHRDLSSRRSFEQGLHEDAGPASPGPLPSHLSHRLSHERRSPSPLCGPHPHSLGAEQQGQTHLTPGDPAQLPEASSPDALWAAQPHCSIAAATNSSANGQGWGAGPPPHPRHRPPSPLYPHAAQPPAHPLHNQDPQQPGQHPPPPLAPPPPNGGSAGTQGEGSILAGLQGQGSTRAQPQPPSLAPNSQAGSGGLGLWLNSPLEPEHSARSETFSPSKGELLANLKRRQIEKRSTSAQVPQRPGGEESAPPLAATREGAAWLLPSQGSAFTAALPQDMYDHLSGADPASSSSTPTTGTRRNPFPHTAPCLPSYPSTASEASQLSLPGALSSFSSQGLGSPLNPSGPSCLPPRPVAAPLGAPHHAPPPPPSHTTQGSGGSFLANRAIRGAPPPAPLDTGLATRLLRGPSPPPCLPPTRAASATDAYADAGNAATAGLAGSGLGDSHSSALTGASSPKTLGLSRLTPTLRGRSSDALHHPLHPLAATHTAHAHLSTVPAGPGSLDSSGSSSSLAQGGGLGGCSAPGSPAAPLPHRMGVSQGGGGPGGGGGGGPGGAAATAGYWDKAVRALEELSAADLTPLEEPERALKAAVAKMIEANNADRKELDWQGHYEALNDARRLVRHHPDVLKASLHELVRAASPSIDQLRSLTVKNVLLLVQEMFQGLGKTMDRELDELVPCLLKKAGEISNAGRLQARAGRENFLTSEADRTLTEMCRVCSETRVITALTASANHKSMHVRAKVASQLDGLMELNSGLARTLLASAPACLDRLFRTAAGFLEEGALETRTYGKRLIWAIKTSLASRPDFERLVAQLQPEALSRKVSDVVESSNGPPPPPTRGALGQRQPGGPRQVASSDARPSPSPLKYLEPGGVGPGGGPGAVLSGRALQDATGSAGNSSTGASSAGRQQQQTGQYHQSVSAPVGSQGLQHDYKGAGPGPGPGGGAGVKPGQATPERRRLQHMPSWRTRTSEPDEPAGPLQGPGTAAPSAAPAASSAPAVRAAGAGLGVPPLPGGRGGASTTRRRPSLGPGQLGPQAAGPSGGGDGAGGGVGAGRPGLQRGDSFSPGQQEVLAKALGGLGSKDFRERLEALRGLEGVVASSGGLVGASETQLQAVMDGLVARLNDGNAKVVTAVLEGMTRMAGALRERVQPGLNTLVPALAAALGSTNEKIRAAAADAADALVASVDGALLVQHMSHCVAHGQLRGKPALVERLQQVLRDLWPSRPALVVKHAVPAAFSLLNDPKGEGKLAAQAMLAGLSQLMGQQLLSHAASLQPAAQQRVADAVAAASVS